MPNISKPRLVILNELDSNHRYLRLQEENAGRMIIEKINVRDALVTSKGVFYQNEFVTITKDDLVWATSNTEISHFIINAFCRKAKFIWPNRRGIEFSDKFSANSFFDVNGVPTPRTAFVNKADMAQAIEYVGGFPCVVKKTTGSHGKQVELVYSKQEVDIFMKETLTDEKAFFMDTRFFILQEYVPESKGIDFRVLCLEGEVLGAMKRTAKSGFKANISLGGTAEQVPVDMEMERLCKKIMKKGKLFYAGIDFIKSNRGYLAIEINTAAQFKGFEKATGVNVAGKIIEKLLELSKGKSRK